MTKILAALAPLLWWAAYLFTITLASVALPVQCRCGDQLPGPRALIVAVAEVQPATSLAPGASALTELPTTLEAGLAAIALPLVAGALLVIPRPGSPPAAIRRLTGRIGPPQAPPPRSLLLPGA